MEGAGATRPSREWALYEELTKIVDQLAARDSVGAFQSVEGVCEKVWGRDVGVKVTGSYLQQTAIVNSDLDVGLEFPKRMRILGDAHYLSVLLNHIKTHSGYGLCVKEELLQAAVPLLRLLHSESGLTIDISVSSEFTGRTDVLLANLIEANPYILPTVSFVKHWAQRRRVVGAYEGFLNSVSWVALVLSYCQNNGLTPSLDGIPSWRLADVRQQATADLLVSFFNWVAGLWSGHGSHGLQCNLETGEQTYIKSEKPIILSDPGRPGNILSSSTRRCMWQDVTKECRRAADMIERGRNFRDVLEQQDGGGGNEEVIPQVGVTTSRLGVVLQPEEKIVEKKVYKAPGGGRYVAAGKSQDERFAVGGRVASLDLRIEGSNKVLQGYRGVVTCVKKLSSGVISVRFDNTTLGDLTLSAKHVVPVSPLEDSSSETSSSASAESTIISTTSSSTPAALGMPYGYYMPPPQVYPVLPIMPPDCAINPVDVTVREH